MQRINPLLIFLLAFCFCSHAQERDDYIKLALQSYQDGDYPKAIDLSEKQIATNTRLDEAHFIIARSLMSRGYYTMAIDAFSESLDQNHKNAEAYALRGYCYYLMKDYKLARLDMIESCFLDTANALYHFNLGELEQKMNKKGEAIKSYTMAIKHDPYYVDAYRNRGYIYLNRYDYALAMHDFDSALKYRQNDPDILLYKGTALVAMKRYKDGINLFERSMRLKEKNPSAYLSRGLVRFAQKDFVAAIKDFDTATMYNPSMELAYFNRGLARLELDKKRKMHPEACEDFRKALEYGYIDALFYLKTYCE